MNVTCRYCKRDLQGEPPSCAHCGWRPSEEELARSWTSSWRYLEFALNGAIVVLLIGLAGYAYSHWTSQWTYDDISPRRACAQKLEHGGRVLLVYEQRNGSLPPAFVVDANGKPLFSWRCLLLRLFAREDLANRFDASQAWNSWFNAPLATAQISYLALPDDDEAVRCETNFVVVVDPNGVFTGSTPVRLAEVTDRFEETILAIESPEAIPWPAPHDPTTAEVVNWLQQGRLGRHRGKANVLFLDGHVESIPVTELTPQLLRAMVTRNGGEKIVRTWTR